MKYLTVIIIFLCLRCSADRNRTSSLACFRPKIVNKKVERDLDSCLSFSNRLILERFTKKEFLKYFKLEIVGTNYAYDSVQGLLDTLKLPESYYVIYNFIYKKDSLGSFHVYLDSLLKPQGYGYYDLIAFKKIIDKQFKITKEQAIQIAMNNGLTKKIKVALECSRLYPDTTNVDSATYFWQCMNDCQNCPWVNVDAMSGNIIDSGTVSVEY